MSDNLEIDVQKIPEGSGLYRILTLGRRVLPEDEEQYFVTRVNGTVAEHHRDYRELIDLVVSAAAERGYRVEERANLYAMLAVILRSISVGRNDYSRVALFTDMIEFAIRACPKVEDNIYT